MIRELFRGAVAASWAVALLVLHDLASVPASDIPEHGAWGFLAGLVGFVLGPYLLAFGGAAATLAVGLRAWNRLAPTALRLPGDSRGFHAGAMLGIFVLAVGLPVLSRRSGGPDSGIALLLLEGQFLFLGALASAALYRWLVNGALARPAPASRLAALALLPALPLLAGIPGLAGALRSEVPSPPPPGEERPDIFLIVAGTMRADALGAGSGDSSMTPALDALAARGVRFTQATAQATSTASASASILTGLMPSEHGMIRPGDSIRPAATLISGDLAARGYRTAAIVTGNGVTRERGFRRGFHSWNDAADRRPAALHGSTHASKILQALGFIHPRREPRSAAEMVDEALAVLEQAPDRPLFLYLHLNDPNPPYFPGKEEARRADPGYEGPFDFGPGDLSRIMRGEAAASTADIRHARALYQAEISAMDHAIGRLLDRMQELRAGREQVIIFTSDHGEEFLDHGGLGHEHSLYEELVRVPLIIASPGRLPAGTLVERPVGHLSLAPTIREMAGAPAGASTPGQGPALFVSGELRGTFPEGPILSEQTYAGSRARSHLLRAARSGSTKLILSSPNAFGVGPWRREAYDLASDPEERIPLTESPDGASALEAALREHISRIDGVDPGREGGPEAAGIPSSDEGAPAP